MWSHKLVHVRQPRGSSLCGHSCVAMVLGIPLEEAVALVGHRRGMRNYELVKALGDRVLCKKSVPARQPPPDPSVMRVKGPKSNWHLALYKGGTVYDPDVPFPVLYGLWKDYVIDRRRWRIVSFFPLKP